MGASPPPKTTPPDAALNDVEHGDRPTVVPDFNPDAFARDSEVKLRAISAGGSEPTVEQARKLRRDGQHEEALFLLTRLLELAPLHPEASQLAAECRKWLEHDCLAAIGSEAAILVVAVPPAELTSFALDNVSGFLLSVMDGATDVETILDISSLPRLLALRHLRSLLDRGIVAVASRKRSR